jgi:hypothetical protein
MRPESGRVRVQTGVESQASGEGDLPDSRAGRAGRARKPETQAGQQNTEDGVSLRCGRGESPVTNTTTRAVQCWARMKHSPSPAVGQSGRTSKSDSPSRDDGLS